MPDSQSTMILSVPIICIHTCTGGARPLVARARAPVCPSLAMPLWCIYAFRNLAFNSKSAFSIPMMCKGYKLLTPIHTSILNLLVYFCYKILLRHAGLSFLSISSETGAVMLASRPAPDNSIPKPGFPMRSFFGIEPVIVNQKVCSNTS